MNFMTLKITQYSFVHGTESDQRLSVFAVRQSVVAVHVSSRVVSLRVGDVEVGRLSECLST